VTTMVTSPEPMETLVAFYRRVRPAGPGWEPVIAVAGVPRSTESMPRAIAAWVLGCFLIYALLFGIGCLILGPRLLGAGLIAGAAAAGGLIFKVFEPERQAQPQQI